MARVAGRGVKFRIPAQVAGLVRGLHPELKRKVRAGLECIARDADSGKALQGELEGLRSMKVGRFRIIYRSPAQRVIEIVAIGPRDRIYEATLGVVSRRKPT